MLLLGVCGRLGRPVGQRIPSSVAEGSPLDIASSGLGLAFAGLQAILPRATAQVATMRDACASCRDVAWTPPLASCPVHFLNHLRDQIRDQVVIRAVPINSGVRRIRWQFWFVTNREGASIGCFRVHVADHGSNV